MQVKNIASNCLGLFLLFSFFIRTNCPAQAPFGNEQLTGLSYRALKELALKGGRKPGLLNYRLRAVSDLYLVDGSCAALPAGLNSKKLNPQFEIAQETLPFFCRMEHQLALKTALPFKFRLGSVEYVDWLEGKPGSTSYLPK